jgi:hypothetical protein
MADWQYLAFVGQPFIYCSFFEKKTPGLIVQAFLSTQIEKPA